MRYDTPNPREDDMTTRRTVTLHVVRRLGWEDNEELYYRPSPEELEEYGIEPWLDETPVQAFLGRAAAEAAARALDAKERADYNPFVYNGDGSQLSSYTTLTATQFRDRLAAVGLKPPALNRVG